MNEPDNIAPGHNPAKLTNAQVGEGWRLLADNEIYDFPGGGGAPVDQWRDGGWMTGFFGAALGYCYRTRRNRSELRAARGLPPEPLKPEPESGTPVSDRIEIGGPALAIEWLTSERDRLNKIVLEYMDGKLAAQKERDEARKQLVDNIRRQGEFFSAVTWNALGTRETLLGEQLLESLKQMRAELAAANKNLAALPGDWLYDSSLETWFPVTARYLADTEKELAEARKQLAELTHRHAQTETFRFATVHDLAKARLELEAANKRVAELETLLDEECRCNGCGAVIECDGCGNTFYRHHEENEKLKADLSDARQRIGELERENERIKREELGPYQCYWRDRALLAEKRCDERDALKAETLKLREIIQKHTAFAGGTCSLESSIEFLAQTPDETRLVIDGLKAEIETVRDALFGNQQPWRNCSVAKLQQQLAEKSALCERLRKCLSDALDFQVSNRGTEDAFYTCYTYTHGRMPDWVKSSTELLQRAEGKV